MCCAQRKRSSRCFLTNSIEVIRIPLFKNKLLFSSPVVVVVAAILFLSFFFLRLAAVFYYSKCSFFFFKELSLCYGALFFFFQNSLFYSTCFSSSPFFFFLMSKISKSASRCLRAIQSFKTCFAKVDTVLAVNSGRRNELKIGSFSMM